MSNFVEEELCRQAFAMFDKSGSGTISKTELTSLLRAMGQNPTDSQVNDMINEVDVDGSGVVEFNEFVNFFRRNMNMDPENEAKEAFRRFDAENEGYVRLDEIKFVLSNLPVKLSVGEIDEIIDAIQASASVGPEGRISQETFTALIGMQPNKDQSHRGHHQRAAGGSNSTTSATLKNLDAAAPSASSGGNNSKTVI